MTTETTNVVTYSTQLETRSLCERHIAGHEAAGTWPTDRTGQDLVDVAHGQHEGACDDCMDDDSDAHS